MKKVFLLLALSVLIITGSAQTRRTNVRKTAQKPKVTNIARKTATVDIKALADTLRDLKHQVKMEQLKLLVFEKPLTQKLSDETTFKVVDCWQDEDLVCVKFEVHNMNDSPRLKIPERNITAFVDDNKIAVKSLYRGESSILDYNRIDLNQGVTDNFTVCLYVKDHLAKAVNQLKIFEENSKSQVEFREIPIRKADGSLAIKGNNISLQDSVKILKSYLKDLKRRNNITPIQTKKLADGTVFELISCNYDNHSIVEPIIRIYNHNKTKNINYNNYLSLASIKFTFEGNEKKISNMYIGYDVSITNKFTVEKNIYTNLSIICYVDDRLPKFLDKIELEDQTTHEKVIFTNIKVER